MAAALIGCLGHMHPSDNAVIWSRSAGLTEEAPCCAQEEAMAAEPIRGLGHMKSSETFYEATSGSQPAAIAEDAPAGSARGQAGPPRQAGWRSARVSSRQGPNPNRAALRQV